MCSPLYLLCFFTYLMVYKLSCLFSNCIRYQSVALFYSSNPSLEASCAASFVPITTNQRISYSITVQVHYVSSSATVEMQEKYLFHEFIFAHELHICANYPNMNDIWHMYSANEDDTKSYQQLHTRWFIITGPHGFQRHNLINMPFLYTKLSRPEREIMLCEVVS